MSLFWFYRNERPKLTHSGSLRGTFIFVFNSSPKLQSRLKGAITTISTRKIIGAKLSPKRFYCVNANLLHFRPQKVVEGYKLYFYMLF